MTVKLHPNDGGCWICHREIINAQEYRFSIEFDTWVHEDCIQAELVRYKMGTWLDTEVDIMLKEFNLI